MSSIFFLKNQGKNRAFFSLIFAHFLLKNHSILWSEWLIYRFDHNASSELPFQRGPIASDWCRISPVCIRELLQGHFYLKIAIFSTAFVIGNRSMPLFLLIYMWSNAFP